MAKLKNIDDGLMLCIDFGTTNSVVSFYNSEADSVSFINIDGSFIFPSAILFTKENGSLSYTCGVQARDASLIYPESTILSIKSLLGSNDKVTISVDETKYSFASEQIVGFILEEIKNKSNEFIKNEFGINNEFTKLVVTVPANSTDKQKSKTRLASILAGFDEDNIYIRLEPSAAAIGYAYKSTNDSKVLIYDFGGGTFDACLLDIQMDNKKPVVSIKNTSGDNILGGNNVDKIILDIIYEEFKQITENKINLFDDDYELIDKNKKIIALTRLLQTATYTKERLSKTNKVMVALTPLIQEPFIVNISMEITKEMFLNHRRINQLDDSDEVFEKFKGKNLEDIIDLTITEIDNCLDGAKIDKTEVDEVFLVGGSSGLPLVFQKVNEYFGKEPFKAKINPALAISEGASIYSKMILDPKNSVLKYIETTVHSLGVEILGRRYLEIIKPNTLIPEEGLTVTCDELFRTSSNNVNKMVIVVYEYTKVIDKNVISVNEKGMIRLCGTTLKGIPEKSKGEEKVSVIFSVSRDNILTVRARSNSIDGVYTELSVEELY